MNQPAPNCSEAIKHGDDRYQASLDYLFGRINYERSPELASDMKSFPLARMQKLLEGLGNPQNVLPCVHIAGSKGKGSTAVMVARILEDAGYRVGLFTSPHLQRYEERFTINGVMAHPEEIVEIVDQLRAVADIMDQEPGNQPTFFELSTAAGWMHFVKNRCDIAVVEVGLGGRLDSTNLCRPMVSVITSISRDHTRLLGETEELIAAEKAGIIKGDVPTICGVTNPRVANVIATKAQHQGAPFMQLGREIQLVSQQPEGLQNPSLAPWGLNFSQGELRLSRLKLAMPGEHQTNNAALAVAAVRQLMLKGFAVTENDIRNGLKSSYVPLRIEVVGRDPVVVIDVAHNIASIQALCDSLRTLEADRKFCIFSSSRDKETDKLLDSLNSTFDEFILTSYQDNPRAVPVEELKRFAKETLTEPFEIVDTPERAMNLALNRCNESDLICVTGSFFLAAEAKRWWDHNRSKES